MVPVAEPAGSEMRTLTVSTGSVWRTWPAQLPASEAGGRAEGRGLGSRVTRTWGVLVTSSVGRVAVGPPVGVGPVVVGWVAGPWCRPKMNTAPTTIASRHTAQATAHRAAPDRDRIGAGGAGGRGVAGLLAGTLAAALACLAPSVSRPAERSRPLRSLASTARATGRVAGSGATHAATTSRRSSGSAARSWGPTGGRPTAANMTVFAHATRSAAGVAAP